MINVQIFSEFSHGDSFVCVILCFGFVSSTLGCVFHGVFTVFQVIACIYSREPGKKGTTVYRSTLVKNLLVKSRLSTTERKMFFFNH